ncbi:MAG TPA: S53 family peptidase [Bryobacteraceae bacterium]|nr:S53 family peptidase [Bryobacteraceae bacterium]
MAARDDKHLIPEGYVQLKGSERNTPRKAKAAGEVDGKEKFSVTIVLRRRTDGPALPDFDYFSKTPPRKRARLSHEEFTEAHGAHPQEIQAVEEFAKKNGLTVKKVHAGRRHVVVEGTAAQFSKAFGVSFKRYELPPAPQRRPGPPPRARRYRGRAGFIHVPKELAESIVGVFGLDDRPIGGRNGLPGDTPITNLISVAQAASEYNFPLPGAAIGGQTIGIVSAGGGVGYVQSDITQTFSAAGVTVPTVYPIAVDGVPNLGAQQTTTTAAAMGGNTLTFAALGSTPSGSIAQYNYSGSTYYLQVTAATATTITTQAWDPGTQSWVAGFLTAIPLGTTVYFNLDGETMQDLAIAGLAAAGANLACYFLQDSQMGWVDMIGRVLHPEGGDFPAGVNPPSVLSSSYFISGGDDPDGLALYGGVTTALLDAVSQAFQDATILVNGPTICIATGDFGSSCGVGSQIGDPTQGDGYAHVQYPASDPWVLGVGGTTLGQYQPSGSATPLPIEFPWNAPLEEATYPWGTSGGGVSDYFAAPSYQASAGVPNSINPGITAPNPSTVTPPAPFNTTGRGVPDVAANANVRTGFSGISLGGVPGAQVGNGTSASSPFWAGLIAVLNSNAGFNIGFANPTLYTLGPGAFNPINPLWADPAYPQLASAPANNSNGGIPGYPTGPGWDAVTGLGSPNGMEILSGLAGLESVYILGGYQSPDIILTDLSTSQPVPIGGLPGGRWDTLLEPSTNYGFSANVHNDGPAEANGVVVTFWAIPGGVGTNGSLVGTPQTVNIPAGSTVTVNASAPFTSAPEGEHLCAVVSLYSPATGCTVDATSALEIPNPGYSMTHECSAWRNTDSMFALMGGAFHFGIGLGRLPIRFEEPIILGINAKHVPTEILKTPAVAKIADTLQAVGAKSNQPLYLMPGVLQSVKTVDLRQTVKGVRGIEVKRGEKGEWLLSPRGGDEQAQLEITGQVPATAKNGDVLLVHVSAQYPRSKGWAARTVEFLEFVYVTDKKR